MEKPIDYNRGKKTNLLSCDPYNVSIIQIEKLSVTKMSYRFRVRQLRETIIKSMPQLL